MDESDREFQENVFPDELGAVRERLVLDTDGREFPRGDGLIDFERVLDPEIRRSVVLNSVLDNLSDAENEKAWREAPGVGHTGLVGLALSGGGIRSATFNLGVIQALQKQGLFRSIDYLSTVSGGSYIGSCITSLFHSLDKTAAAGNDGSLEFPFTHKAGKREPTAFRHLRNNANYLAPKGLIDVLQIPALLLRGIVINLLVIFPYLLLAATFTVLLKPTGDSLYRNTVAEISWLQPVAALIGQEFFITKIVVLALMAMYVVYPAVHTVLDLARRPSDWRSRNRFGRMLSFSFVAIAAAVVIELQPIAIRTLYVFKQSGVAGLVEAGIFGGSALTLLADNVLPHLQKRAAQLAVYFVGALGAAMIWLLYLNLCILGIDFGNPTNFSNLGWTDLPSINACLPLCHSDLLGYYLLVAAGLAAYTALTVDINFTGIHKFYRDRLSKAYIVGLNANGPDSELVVEHTDSLKLSELNSRRAPYQIINALLNLEQTNESHKQGRQGDFFIFSNRYVGGKITGYAPTRKMEQANPMLDLATATAISGAAAAPNMGKVTVKPLIFVLAMLNVRLNYWLPNPRTVMGGPVVGNALRRMGLGTTIATDWIEKVESLPRAPWKRVGPLYLLAEMFGKLTADSWNVNLSDGGHIENLGIYELLRRECRLIIAGDGEADAHFEFEGLSELIRMAQIDFGILIDIDGLDEIRRGEKHYAIGTIHYADHRKGVLVYLKSSLLGDHNLESTLSPEHYTTSPYRDDNALFDHNAYIAHYRAKHPDFPHQSTADQFFDEAQFECYRALGYQVAISTLSD